jgi:hypothetical protein
MVDFQVKWSLETYYFRESKLLDEYCQMCQTRLLCTVWNISRAIGVILLRFRLG